MRADHQVEVYRERAALAERRLHDAVMEAARLRTLWEAAASCLQYNRARLAKARGVDEARLLALAEQADLGPFWAGTTAGWIEEGDAGSR